MLTTDVYYHKGGWRVDVVELGPRLQVIDRIRCGRFGLVKEARQHAEALMAQIRGKADAS